jgi:hypothetical protein
VQLGAALLAVEKAQIDFEKLKDTQTTLYNMLRRCMLDVIDNATGIVRSSMVGCGKLHAHIA